MSVVNVLSASLAIETNDVVNQYEESADKIEEILNSDQIRKEIDKEVDRSFNLLEVQDEIVETQAAMEALNVSPEVYRVFQKSQSLVLRSLGIESIEDSIPQTIPTTTSFLRASLESDKKEDDFKGFNFKQMLRKIWYAIVDTVRTIGKKIVQFFKWIFNEARALKGKLMAFRDVINKFPDNWSTEKFASDLDQALKDKKLRNSIDVATAPNEKAIAAALELSKDTVKVVEEDTKGIMDLLKDRKPVDEMSVKALSRMYYEDLSEYINRHAKAAVAMRAKNAENATIHGAVYWNGLHYVKVNLEGADAGDFKWTRNVKVTKELATSKDVKLPLHFDKHWFNVVVETLLKHLPMYETINHDYQRNEETLRKLEREFQRAIDYVGDSQEADYMKALQRIYPYANQINQILTKVVNISLQCTNDWCRFIEVALHVSMKTSK